MSISISTMSLQKPSFKSNLPEYLLQDASPRDKYILENLNITGQVQNWLIDETVKQSGKLESIESQTIRTNGRVNRLEEKNLLDKNSNKELQQVVNINVFVKKYLLNKYAVGVIFILVVGIVKIVINDELRGFLFKIIGLG